MGRQSEGIEGAGKERSDGSESKNRRLTESISKELHMPKELHMTKEDVEEIWRTVICTLSLIV